MDIGVRGNSRQAFDLARKRYSSGSQLYSVRWGSEPVPNDAVQSGRLGRMGLALTEEYQEELRLVQKEIGFKPLFKILCNMPHEWCREHVVRHISVIIPTYALRHIQTAARTRKDESHGTLLYIGRPNCRLCGRSLSSDLS